ncbi:MAG TPA: fused MFS/spermidine synthase [Thermoanaerobaculia bacterium]
MRSFSLLFGSTTRAAAAVLGAFFGGLAVGGLVGARLARRRSPALWRYGVAEIAVAAGALLVPVWIGLFGALYPRLYLAGGWTPGAAKLLLAFAAMGLPCVAMGATLPLVARALVDTAGHLGRRAGVAYGLNTLGATAGVLLAGFVLPPFLGTRGSVWLAAALNVAAGAVALALGRRGRAGLEDAEAEEEEVEPAPARSDPGVLAVVFASGFGTVALEVLTTRLIVNVTDSSVFSFALMLAAFLVYLALAALAVSRVVDRVRDPWRLLAWTQSLAVVAILVAPALFNVSSAMAPAAFWPYLGSLFARLTLVVGPAILLAGVALPVAWKIASRHAAETGSRIGRLTSLNTFGAVAGSVVTGFVLVPSLGVNLSVGLIALLYAVVAVLCWARGYGGRRALLAGVAIAAVIAALLSLGTIRAYQLLLAPGQRVVSFIEGESVNIGVVEDPRLGRVMKVNNNYTLGRSDPLAVALQRNQTGLPLLLRPGARSVAYIGVGTAVSVSPVVEFPVERVVAIELLREVVDSTPYMEANRGVLKDPRVEILVADGRNHLYATAERFDVIVGDLFVPWHAGTGYLYTEEHFRAVARRLAPGGLYAQWLPPHQMSAGELRMIVATFLAVFPAAELWLSDPGPRGGMGTLALVAWDGAGPPPGARRAAAESRRFPGLALLCGPRALREWSAGARTNTDDFPRLEFSAAVSRFRKDRNLGEMNAALAALRRAGQRDGTLQRAAR